MASVNNLTTRRPLYIFDLDGTLALIDHRISILDDIEDPGRWRKFYALCDKDKPNIPVIQTLEKLRSAGADIWFFSGRSDEVRDKTVAWISEHTGFMSFDLADTLMMRNSGDYTPDDVLKNRWFDNMMHIDKARLVAVFEDRDRVVEMWRSNGVTCFQVAKGDF